MLLDNQTTLPFSCLQRPEYSVTICVCYYCSSTCFVQIISPPALQDYSSSLTSFLNFSCMLHQ